MASSSTQKVKRFCPPGQIRRASYVRRFGSSVKAKGYNRVTKNGKIVHIVPKKASAIVVKSACIKDRKKHSVTQKRMSKEQRRSRSTTRKIGPLRVGLLKKYGYRAALPRRLRHKALHRAIKAYGATSVYHKLDAVAKLSARTHPKSSRIFAEDRDWVRHLIKRT